MTESAGIKEIRENYKIQAEGSDRFAQDLKEKVSEPYKKLLDTTYKKEKQKYNDFLASQSTYNKAKDKLLKAEQAYKAAGELAEKMLLTFVGVKGTEESKKLEVKVDSLFAQAQKAENYYNDNVKIVEQCRKDLNDKETSLLQTYQSMDKEFQDAMKVVINGYINSLKEIVSAMSIHLDTMSTKLISINSDEDMTKFIEQNTTQEAPIKEIPFKPFVPATTPDDTKLKQDDIFYVIQKIKKHLPNVLPGFDIEKEKQKLEIRQLSNTVFKTNVAFSQEKKQQLIDVIKDREKRIIFLYELNRQRTIGKFAREEKLISDLNEILNEILNISEQEKDYDSAKNCIILSQTFFYEKEGVKHYLFESISGNNWLKSTDFWYGVIDYMIKKEFARNETSNKEIISKETEEERKKRVSNIAFSQVLPYTNNMLEFKMDKDIILQVIDKYVQEYEIEKDAADAIITNVTSTQY